MPFNAGINTMKAKPVEINWHPGLSVFARESFLKSFGNEYGWIGGVSDRGELRCVLPYTVIKKAIFRMVRFRVETIPIGGELEVQGEKSFLNNVMEYFRSIGADMVIPASNNAIFRTYPEGADAAPYGSYVIDLGQPEEILWRNIGKVTRQNISTAQKNGVCILSGFEHLDTAYTLIRNTFRKSKLPFMNYDSFKRYAMGLGENAKLLVADYQGVVQSCNLYAFSDYCAYAVYAGSIEGAHQGAMKLIQWEAIRLFRTFGVKRFDFMGARIDPEKGSKQEALNQFKKRFGATLKQGFMWKYSIHPLKYRLYCLAAHLRSGGDIVDAERHKLKGSSSIEIK
ncbi:MAG: peptidoglycan bridge formation glycyltransferase FemA/FemB family protein [Candidatus Helarchaeota archaeon]|nr:peptidoglycan bridge formation glycyltransferase FemA/FemB family protein [Candidatus Helarchaeota archaeon]